MASQRSLTQHQWLSIMMIATAFMILLFTVIGKVLEQKLAAPIPNQALPFSHLSKISIGEWSAALNTENNTCTQQPKVIPSSQCFELFEQWHKFEPIANSNLMAQTPMLTLELELETNQTWYLYLEPSLALAQANSQNFFMLTPKQLKRLLPDQLLNFWRTQQSTNSKH